MSFRDDILANVVQPLMPLLGPTGFDVHTSSVVIQSRQYPSSPGGADAGLGTPTDTSITLTPRPKVRDLGDQRLEVSLIVPSNANGGYTPAQLKPADAKGFRYRYLVTGPDGVERAYLCTEIDTRNPFFYSVILTPLDRKIPF
jgi:hypothetical protein